MTGMFHSCGGLGSLDVSTWNTSNVTNMRGMFYRCASLRELDLRSFDTSKVTDMGQMFSGCKSLINLDLSSFNTEKVTSMRGMFEYSSSLTGLDLSSFNTKNVLGFQTMFQDCKSLNTIYIGKDWDVEHVPESYNNQLKENTFLGCESLVGQDGTVYDENKIVADYAYAGEGGYMTLMTDEIREKLVTQKAELATLIEKLQESIKASYKDLDAKDPTHDESEYWDLYNDADANVKSLTDKVEVAFTLLDLKACQQDSVVTKNLVDELIDKLAKLEYVGDKVRPYAVVSEDKTTLTFYYDGKKLSRGGMSLELKWADDASSIESVVIDKSFAEYTELESTAGWFAGFMKLTSIAGLEHLNTSNVTDMHDMFHDCRMLKTIDVSSFNTENVTNMGGMFGGCYSLDSLDLSHFKTSKVTNMIHMFISCIELKHLDVSHFNTSKVKVMYQMFSGFQRLTELDLSSFDTRSLEEARYMFDNSVRLKTIYIDGKKWKLDALQRSENMFRNCTRLVGQDGTTYDKDKTDATYAHAGEGGYLTQKAMELEPVSEDEAADYGKDGNIAEGTDLSGTVIDNMYYSIGTDAGGYNSEEGCIVITQDTNDEQMELLKDLGIGDEELAKNFTGIIFKVPAGSGKVTVNAQTTGNMTLKVKVGDGLPMEMELSGKLKMKFPYSVSKESLVYIYAGTADVSEARATAKTAPKSSLKIYGIEWESTVLKGDANGDGMVNESDIVEVVNYIMGNKSDNFVESAADVNGDNVVNASDIAKIVDIIISAE